MTKSSDEKATAIEEPLEERSRELRESEAFNAALFDYSPIEMIVVDSDGRIVKCNRARVHSGARLPVVGERMYIDYAAHHETDRRAALMDCIDSGEAEDFPESRYGDKVLSIKIAAFPIGDSRGAVIASQDITKRLRAEAIKD